MFYGRIMEHRINRMYETILQIIYPDDSQLNFIELVKKGKTVTVHRKALATETLANPCKPLQQKYLKLNTRLR